MTPARCADLADLLAPGGTLRAAINTGNPLLAVPDPVHGAKGVSVDLARGLAQRLGVPLSLTVYDGAGKAVKAVAEQAQDIGFFAVDPLRAQGVLFTPEYLLIEGCYAVREDSPVRTGEEVDVPGRRVVVGRGSAYDLFLARELKHARLEHAASSPGVVDHFLAVGADVAAGVKQQLEADAARCGGLRLLPGRFMLIRQAMGCPSARGAAAAQALADYVGEALASGAVAASLQRHGVTGATLVRVPGNPPSDGGVFAAQ